MKMQRTKSRRGSTRAKLDRPRPVDAHVGSRVRLRRTLLGMSQQKLAAALGVTFQQVQKNERGTNRIASSRLFDLSKTLDVPIQYFFDEMPAETAASARSHGIVAAKSAADHELDPLAKRETLELVRAYYRIKSPSVRKRVYGLAKTLGGDGD